ncbi:MAG: siroheme synthase [Sphingobacteriaceae bacterium]|nr:siroheme synthase [Sphingobacteriaceae bacterium]
MPEAEAIAISKVPKAIHVAENEKLSKKHTYSKLKVTLWTSAFVVAVIALVVLWNYHPSFKGFVERLSPTFYYFLAAGFVFAMIDGAIGMSYGVTSTSFALAMGVPPASASTAVHLSEILSCGIAGYIHNKMGNINKKLFWLLLIPGIAGAVVGAFLLSSLEHYSDYTKPLVSLYTLILGWVILNKAISLKPKSKGDKKIKNIRVLGFGGGFIDAVGGGGWGSIVLSSLIAGARNPRTSLGTVKATRFFIAMLSSLTFIVMLHDIHWDAVAGLIIGSAVASPIAARVSNRISVKSIMIAVSIIVMLVSIRSIIKVLTGIFF